MACKSGRYACGRLGICGVIMKAIQAAYIEKTRQSVKGWIEFNEVFVDNKSLGFIPRFYVVEKLIPFEYYSKIEVGNVSFTGYCGAYSIIGKEPITAEGLYEFSKNLRFGEMQSK